MKSWSLLMFYVLHLSILGVGLVNYFLSQSDAVVFGLTSIHELISVNIHANIHFHFRTKVVLLWQKSLTHIASTKVFSNRRLPSATMVIHLSPSPSVLQTLVRETVSCLDMQGISTHLPDTPLLRVIWRMITLKLITVLGSFIFNHSSEFLKRAGKIVYFLVMHWRQNCFRCQCAVGNFPL